MKRSTHMKGPWRVHSNQMIGILGNEPIMGYKIKQDYGSEFPIATLWIGGGTRGKPTQKANAHLIAAAPELLEACQAADALIDHLFAGKFDATALNDVPVRLKAAIAKAKGKEGA